MTIGSHQRSVGKTDTHLTPKWLIDALGPFDLDPCAAPAPRPWDCACENIAVAERDGLKAEWRGVVWLNPPFNRYGVGAWVRRFIDHGNGVLLLHARTETEWFAPAWGAPALLFLSRRIKFCDARGNEARANSGAPVVLVGAGEGVDRILRSGLPGWLVTNARRAA